MSGAVPLGSIRGGVLCPFVRSGTGPTPVPRQCRPRPTSPSRGLAAPIRSDHGAPGGVLRAPAPFHPASWPGRQSGEWTIANDGVMETSPATFSVSPAVATGVPRAVQYDQSPWVGCRAGGELARQAPLDVQRGGTGLAGWPGPRRCSPTWPLPLVEGRARPQIPPPTAAPPPLLKPPVQPPRQGEAVPSLGGESPGRPVARRLMFSAFRLCFHPRPRVPPTVPKHRTGRLPLPKVMACAGRSWPT